MDKFVLFMENLSEHEPSLVDCVLEGYSAFLEGEATLKAVQSAEDALGAETPAMEPLNPIAADEEFQVSQDPSQITEEPIVNDPQDDLSDLGLPTPPDETNMIDDDDLDQTQESPLSESQQPNYESEVLRQMHKDDLAMLLDEAIRRQYDADPGYVPMIISKAKGYIANPNLMSENALAHFLQKRISAL